MKLRRWFETLRTEKPNIDRLRDMKTSLAEESALDVYYLALTMGACAMA